MAAAFGKSDVIVHHVWSVIEVAHLEEPKENPQQTLKQT